jgi:hypothetical protein
MADIDAVLERFDARCEEDSPLTWIASVGDGEPHLAPVCFVKHLGERRLLIASVFLRKTLRNIQEGSRVALGVSFTDNGRDGYLVKGTAIVKRSGPLFQDFREEIKTLTGGKRIPRSVILVKVKEAYSLKPRTGRKKIQ